MEQKQKQVEKQNEQLILQLNQLKEQWRAKESQIQDHQLQQDIHTTQTTKELQDEVANLRSQVRDWQTSFNSEKMKLEKENATLKSQLNLRNYELDGLKKQNRDLTRCLDDRKSTISN